MLIPAPGETFESLMLWECVQQDLCGLSHAETWNDHGDVSKGSIQAHCLLNQSS